MTARAAPLVAAALALGSSLLIGQAPANAESCRAGGGSGDDFISVNVECQSTGDSSNPKNNEVSSSGSGELAFLRYQWHSPCVKFSPADQPGEAAECPISRACPDPQARSWQLWGLAADTRDWTYLSSRCFAGTQPPPPAATPKPQVTPGLVLTELRRIGLPSLQARTQPRDKTLVNFATIFYAEPQTFTRTLTLLGQSVDVEATPTSFTWHYGDGSSATTSTPGAPYPAKDVTHSYTDAHITVQPLSLIHI